MKRYRGIEVWYVPATATKPTRLKLVDTWRSESVILAKDFVHADAEAQAVNVLRRRGFNPVGVVSPGDGGKSNWLCTMLIESFEGSIVRPA